MVLGGLIENEIFGEIKKYKYFEDLPNIDSYVKFGESIKAVRNMQLGSPEKPSKFVPKDLKKNIEQLFLRDTGKEINILFYTAVGSHLDRYHGIDGFFEINEDGRKVIVTMDVTANPNKDSYKADIILSVPRDGIDDVDEGYKEFIELYARRIERAFLTKMEEGGILVTKQVA